MRPLDLYDEHLAAASEILADLPPYKGCDETCPHKHNRTYEERAAAVYLLHTPGPYRLADGRTVDTATMRRQLVRLLPLWDALAGVR